MNARWLGKWWKTCVLLVFGWLPALGMGQTEDSPERLKVATTFFPVYVFVANVAGTHAEVFNLLPANVGPHDYQATQRDIKKLNTARVVFMNGLGLENWLEKLIKAGGKKQTVVEIWSRVEKTNLMDGHDHHHHEKGHEHGGPNPHLWLDPVLAKQAVLLIQESLQKADPANREAYAKNASEFMARLDRLHEQLEKDLAKFRGTPVVTYHNSFPYFLKRYGLKSVGVLEEVADVEPSQSHITQLLGTMRREKVRVIFTEPQYSDKLPRRLAEDLKIKTAQLDPLETGPLSLDAYEKAMLKNVQQLLKGLTP